MRKLCDGVRRESGDDVRREDGEGVAERPGDLGTPVRVYGIQLLIFFVCYFTVSGPEDCNCRQYWLVRHLILINLTIIEYNNYLLA